MTGSDFINEFAKRAHLSSSEAYNLVKIYHNIVLDSLMVKEKIAFIGFGIYDVAYRKGRKVKSPIAGDIVTMESGYRPIFKFSKTISYKVLAAATIDKNKNIKPKTKDRKNLYE